MYTYYIEYVRDDGRSDTLIIEAESEAQARVLFCAETGYCDADIIDVDTM